MYLARLRYIQAIHESPELRNPDNLVGHFLSTRQRVRALWLSREDLARLRANPFYYYVLARTRHYDQVLRDAVSDGVQRIVSVGCGSDTRAYRFAGLLRSHGVRVLECDQPDAIRRKERLVRWWRPADHVGYLDIDLNDEEWSKLDLWLRRQPEARTLLMIEGVSPYINDDAFDCFLRSMATTLFAGSHIAYDFKLRGINDDFGATGRTSRPFRLPSDRAEVAAFHERRGLRLQRMEFSTELWARLLPSSPVLTSASFDEDGLVMLVK